MTDKIKQLNKSLKEQFEERNKEIIQEAVFEETDYRTLGAKYSISGERVKQILHSHNVRVPLKKGGKKYEVWRKKLSKSRP